MASKDRATNGAPAPWFVVQDLSPAGLMRANCAQADVLRGDSRVYRITARF
ncbi:MAG: hypothetical protein U0Z53_06885 [Blastocatellia bacterium]